MILENYIKKHKFSALYTLFGIALFILLLCIVFEPRFETNDDVAMSMIAHGYGDAAFSSPLLVYSNVIWGFIVSSIPPIAGVLGYSWATIIVLVIAGWAITFFLIQMGVGYLVAFLAGFIVLARAVLFPQFTITAGLLTVAGLLGARLYSKNGKTLTLFFSCALIYLGFLIRLPECLLVIAISLPLLPWESLRKNRKLQIAFALILSAMAASYIADKSFYSEKNWERHYEIFKPLASIAAWGKGEDLKLHPELLKKYRYSLNDIELVQNAFWVDPNISNPSALGPMLDELAEFQAVSNIKVRLIGSFKDLEVLKYPSLLPIALMGFMLFLLHLNLRLTFVWLFFLIAIVTLAFLGRPTVHRVYYPMSCLALLAPLTYYRSEKKLAGINIRFILIFAFLWNASIILPQAIESTKLVKEYQRDLQGVPALTIVNWANSVHHEFPYSLFASDQKIRSIRLYDISGSITPVSVAFAEQMAGRSFARKLFTAEGVVMFDSGPNLSKKLEIYCSERLGSRFEANSIYSSPRVNASRVRCVVDE